MKEKLLESFKALLDSIISGTPKVLTVIVLLIVAWIVAKIVEKVLSVILTRVKFDSLVKAAGVDTTLQKIGIRQELNVFIPRVVYFLLLFLVIKTAADALGVAAISDALAAFFAYMPNLFAALLLVVLGTAAAQFAGDAVSRGAENAGIEFASSLGRVVSALIFFIIGIMIFAQLKIDTEIVRLITAFSLAALALAFGVSFGLGAREITRNIMAGFYTRKILKIGEKVEIAGQQGVLKAVTPTHTLLQADDRTINISNGKFLDEISSQ